MPQPSRSAPPAPDSTHAAPADTRPAQQPEWSAGSVVDRRSGLDRREIAARLAKLAAASGAPTPPPAPADDASSTGLERRRGPGRRRTDFTKSAEEGEMTSEQFMFVLAIEAFKKANGRMFPTWTDVLEVVRKLGYRKTMPSELSLRGAEDWREPADAPSGVHAKPGHPEHPSMPRREAA